MNARSLTVNKSTLEHGERKLDINEIPLVMNIRFYMFEPQAVNNNEENTPTSSDDTEVSTSRYTQV